MQRHGVQISGPIFGNAIDIDLYKIQQTLQNNYWKGRQGVYNFQFLTGNSPIVNTVAPLYFQVLRFSPTWEVDAWIISLEGRVNTDGSIEYASGIKGRLNGDKIKWENWDDHDKEWSIVKYVPPYENPLDLRVIREQACVDSETIGELVEKNYYY